MPNLLPKFRKENQIILLNATHYTKSRPLSCHWHKLSSHVLGGDEYMTNEWLTF